MKRNLLLSIDIGTSAIKTGVFSLAGEMLSTSYIEYPLIQIKPSFVEQDANLWWELTAKSVKNLMSQESELKNEIKAISVSAQGISYVPVDSDGNPLSNAFSWIDTRAKKQAEEIQNYFLDKFEAFNRLGLHIVPTYTLPKILWLKENKPDIFEKAYLFSTCLDFLNKKLVDKFVTDYSIAGGTLAHNIKKLKWDNEVLQSINIPVNKFPSIDWSGTLLGVIQPSAADKIGLNRDVKIVLGGHDQECAALGAGLNVGEVSISMGSASILIAPIDKPIFDPKLRIPCYPHVEKSQYVLEAVVSAAGISFRWLRDLFNTILNRKGGSIYDYDELIKLAENSPPGSNGIKFFPHLSGATSPFWKPHASGVFYGLSLASNPSDIARSLLEGWCYQLQSNLLIIDELTNRNNRVIIFGGGTKSKFIQQLLSNIIGRDIQISHNSETALLGASILAGYGSGQFENLSYAKEMVRKNVGNCRPQQKLSNIYLRYYNEYKKVEKDLLKLMEDDYSSSKDENEKNG